MSVRGEGPSIELSEWYAHFAMGSGGVPSVEGADDSQTRRLGPLTIFSAGSGATTMTFGDPAMPSVALVDGFLFDRRATIAELGLANADPADATLIAAGYRRWGSALLERIAGRYLVAVWDAATGRLLLGHDPLGRHPVYFAAAADGLWFGSNLLALTASGRVSAEPHRLSIALGLLMYWPEAGRTSFDGVRRLRPGWCLEATSAGAMVERRYWDPMPAEDEPWIADEEVLAQFEPALARAVARCEELEPTGILLSGGVDSVTIAALATAARRVRGLPPLVAVCGQTGDALSGEEQQQARVAAALDLPLRVSTRREWRGGRDDVSLTLDLTPQLPEPTLLWWTGAYVNAYRQFARDGLRVLLTGSGGDNWLAVADQHAADLFGGGRIRELWHFIRADIGTGGSSFRWSARRLLWANGLRPHAEAWWARLAPSAKTAYHRRRWQERLPAWLLPDGTERVDLIEHLLSYRTPALTPAGRAPGSYYRHYFRSLTNPYLHYENELAYHIETWTGLRLLSPYHDADLVRFFNRIAPRVLLYGARYKGLLRPVVQKYLPTLGLERQRKEYPLVQRRAATRALRTAIAEAWRGARFDRLAGLGIVDPVRLGRSGAGMGENAEQLGRLFALLSAERWLGGSAAGRPAGAGQAAARV